MMPSAPLAVRIRSNGSSERLEHDHDNMRAALTWAIEADQHEMASRIASGVWWFWNIHGHRKAALESLRPHRSPHIDSVDPALGVTVPLGRAVLAGFDTDSGAGTPRRRDMPFELATQLDEPESLGHARFLPLVWPTSTPTDMTTPFRRVPGFAHSAFEEGRQPMGYGVGNDLPCMDLPDAGRCGSIGTLD